MMTKDNRSWHKESARHSLASRGIKTTGPDINTPTQTINLDARLPHKTVVIDNQLESGLYDPNTKEIHIKNRNPRLYYHEKGHYIWDNRMTKVQKEEFKAAAREQIKSYTGDKRRGIRDEETAEELWAVTYAAVKLNQRVNPIMEKSVRKLLN